MSSVFVIILLSTAAICSGLMAGIYFAFSAFIMSAFNRIEPSKAIFAMNAINDFILRSWFMPLFFGTSILSVLMMAVAFVYWGDAGSGLLLVAGLIYFLGMFACTALFNVPLNNSLAKVDSSSQNAVQAWADYRNKWTRWNHLRTVSSVICCAISIWLLVVH